MANGRLLLPDAQLPRPAARRYGLLDTATALTGLDRHWAAGLTWQANCPAASATYAECLVLDSTGTTPTEEPVDKTQPADQTVDVRGAVPFTAFAEVDCSPVGSWNRGQEWARNALARDEQRQVEEVFALGATPGNSQFVWPNLSGVSGSPSTAVEDDTGALMQPPVDDATPGTGPVDVVYALSILERELAQCYPEQGVIHVPAGFGALLSAWNLCVIDEDGTAVTKAGNRVVIGSGYPGNAPGTATATDPVRYMYATGQVFYTRGEIQTKSREDEFDRTKNTLKAIAERTYVIGFDCNCLLAIGVDTAISGACCENAVS